MIEPPGYVRMGGVFEVDDHVSIAVKQAVFEELIGTVSEPGIDEFGLRIALGLEKPRDEGSGSRPVETVVVIQDSHSHLFRLLSENLLDCLRESGKASDRR